MANAIGLTGQLAADIAERIVFRWQSREVALPTQWVLLGPAGTGKRSTQAWIFRQTGQAKVSVSLAEFESEVEPSTLANAVVLRFGPVSPEAMHAILEKRYPEAAPEVREFVVQGAGGIPGVALSRLEVAISAGASLDECRMLWPSGTFGRAFLESLAGGNLPVSFSLIASAARTHSPVEMGDAIVRALMDALEGRISLGWELTVPRALQLTKIAWDLRTRLLYLPTADGALVQAAWVLMSQAVGAQVRPQSQPAMVISSGTAAPSEDDDFMAAFTGGAR